MEFAVFYDWEEVERDGLEYSAGYCLDVDYTPIVDAIISGPPENWAPAEGGDCEVTKVSLTGLFRTIGTETRPAVVPCPFDTEERLYWEQRFLDEVVHAKGRVGADFREWLGMECDRAAINLYDSTDDGYEPCP